MLADLTELWVVTARGTMDRSLLHERFVERYVAVVSPPMRT